MFVLSNYSSSDMFKLIIHCSYDIHLCMYLPISHEYDSSITDPQTKNIV